MARTFSGNGHEIVYSSEPGERGEGGAHDRHKEKPHYCITMEE